MKPREFHIWEFPKDKVRVLFNVKTQKKFFKDCKNEFNSLKDCSKYLGIKYGTLLTWKNSNLFIPLWAIKKIINKLSWDWKFVEKNIIAYKGNGHGNAIKNPKLPLKESPELFGVMTHLICDGHVDKKTGMPSYINKNKGLINNFNILIKKSFGNSHVNRVKGKRAYFIIYPKVIADLIKHFYDIKFHSEDSYFPKETFSLPKEFSYSVIRAVVDDEGTIRDNRIAIRMKNKKLVEQIKTILLNFIKKSDLMNIKQRGDFFDIAIKSKGLLQFRNKIKLIHPMKINDLDYAIKKQKLRSRGQRYPKGYAQKELLKLLNKKSMKTKELSQNLFIQLNNTSLHLKNLESKNFVRQENEEYSFRWFITESGRKYISK